MGPHARGRWPAIVLLALAAGCATAPVPPLSSATVASQLGGARAVARVDGGEVTAADLESHQAETGLPRAEALDDLIDVILLRAAARAGGVALAPGKLEPEVRAAAEAELAARLGLAVPGDARSLIVDHAWVKDAAEAPKQAAQRAAIEKLRGLCAAGETIPAAFPKVGVGADAAAWHIGDHEEYPYDVVPPDAHDLPAGALSPIIPGDGGLHLFRIVARSGPPPARALVRAALRQRLRKGKVIEILEDDGRYDGR